MKTAYKTLILFGVLLPYLSFSQVTTDTWKLRGYFTIGECIDSTDRFIPEEASLRLAEDNLVNKIKGSYLEICRKAVIEYDIDLQNERKNETPAKLEQNLIMYEKGTNMIVSMDDDFMFVSNDPTMLYMYSKLAVVDLPSKKKVIENAFKLREYLKTPASYCP